MGPIRAWKGQNEFWGLSDVKNAMLFANFAFYDRELRYVVIGGDESIEMKLCLL